eukprot:CAMPEP_0184694554 /NCGR_PEP_ID=MMETSP0313-20130426/2462_1 /TAXON_ID=2792 /ORGANISM="Porphyridium aerugineum, Strain SAG 1380-2" /LENGTH=205 /DNA_ID=CAMNT_0027152851 /DNA_START=107 /DNA_END=724 /DNA_ORIENTATION=+
MAFIPAYPTNSFLGCITSNRTCLQTTAGMKHKNHMRMQKLDNENDVPKAKFRTQDDKSTPRSSFFKKENADSERKIWTANEIMQQEIESTARRLGVDNEPVGRAPAPKQIMDISTVDPKQAFLGSVGAFAMFALIGTMTTFMMNYFELHPDPLNSDWYVIQRVSAVIRTVLLTTFALGSGLTGITSLGLFTLGVRVIQKRMSDKK